MLTKATLRSAAGLGLSHTAFARTVGLSESTILGMSRGNQYLEMGTKSAELASLIVRVFLALDTLLGNSEKDRHLWMTSYNKAFDAIPGEAIQTAEGLARVLAYLDELRRPCIECE